MRCQATRIANCPGSEFDGRRLVCDDQVEPGSDFCEAEGSLLVHHDRHWKINWSSTVDKTERLSPLTRLAARCRF